MLKLLLQAVSALDCVLQRVRTHLPVIVCVRVCVNGELFVCERPPRPPPPDIPQLIIYPRLIGVWEREVREMPPAPIANQ